MKQHVTASIFPTVNDEELSGPCCAYFTLLYFTCYLQHYAALLDTQRRRTADDSDSDSGIATAARSFAHLLLTCSLTMLQRYMQ